MDFPHFAQRNPAISPPPPAVYSRFDDRGDPWPNRCTSSAAVSLVGPLELVQQGRHELAARATSGRRSAMPAVTLTRLMSGCSSRSQARPTRERLVDLDEVDLLELHRALRSTRWVAGIAAR